jgi:hypothetical protein
MDSMNKHTRRKVIARVREILSQCGKLHTIIHKDLFDEEVGPTSRDKYIYIEFYPSRLTIRKESKIRSLQKHSINTQCRIKNQKQRI